MSAGLYDRLRGLSRVLRGLLLHLGRAALRGVLGERVPDDEHGGLMILRIDPDAVPDLTVDVTCQDRSGDAW